MKKSSTKIKRKLNFIKNLFVGQGQAHVDVIAKSDEVHQYISNWLSDVYYEKVSIGENCNTSWYLKETNNKKASYPYDWIFTSPEIISHSIRDEFHSFLDKNMIVEIKKNRAGHAMYHSSLFNHKNPRQQKEFDYYRRAVDRFLKLLKNKENAILFVCTVLQEYEKRGSWKKGFNRDFELPNNQTFSSFKETIAVIKEHNTNVKFIFINQFTESVPSLEIKELDADCLWIDFCSQGRNNGVKYVDKFDDAIIKTIYKGMCQESI